MTCQLWFVFVAEIYGLWNTMGISQPDTPAAQVWGLMLVGKSQIPQGTPNSVQLAWATSNLELLPISKSTLEDLWLAFGHNQIIQLDNSLCLTKVVYTPNKGSLRNSQAENHSKNDIQCSGSNLDAKEQPRVRTTCNWSSPHQRALGYRKDIAAFAAPTTASRAL